MTVTDTTQRFSSRADNYAKYRPSYPVAVVELLTQECGLTPDAAIADIGSGTGILSELLLRNGNRVYAVEPNDAMRAYAEGKLASYPGFVSVPARSEATTLPDASVGFVTAGQAFHWFEPVATRVEWTRILTPGGWVALIWNSLQEDASAFAQGYEALLDRYSLDYHQVSHRNVEDNELEGFFGAGAWQLATFDNPQSRGWEGLAGGLRSGSYTPEPGHPNYTPMMAGLRELFDAHQVDGRVVMPTVTNVYYGLLSS